MILDIYGIPTCGTCKKAIAFLQAHAIPYCFINPKEHPPSQATIRDWVSIVGTKPLRNTSGLSYRALGSGKDSWGDKDWVVAFSQDAMLIKRPVFVRGRQVVLVGFRGSEADLLAKLTAL